VIIPNEKGSFLLEGRKATFDGGGHGNARSLILKEGISDGVVEVFVFLLLFIFVIIFIIIYYCYYI
jgi:hypothetical protein